MDFLSQLMHQLGQQPQQQPQRQAPARQLQQRPIDPKSQGYAPEITYNPNPNTNIPYSAHSMEDATLGNEYMKDPTNPKFLGVDPARFGFPADDTQMPIEVKYPRSNPQSGYYKAGPNSPVEMRHASDPMAQLRQLLGF